MADQQGFWSQGERAGGDDARLLLAEHVHALRQLSYERLRAQADGRARIEEVEGLSGRRFQRRTTVTPARRGGVEELSISVQVAGTGAGGRLDPLAEEIVLAGPGGEMVGEYTLASEGNDPRRYVWPAPWVPYALVAALLLVVVLVLALA